MVLGLALGLGTAVATTGPAAASPQTDLAAKQAEAARLADAIDASHQRAEILNEEYLVARSAVEKAQQQIADAERGLAEAEARAAELQRNLAGRAAQLYISAGNVDILPLDVADVRELGARGKYGAAAASLDRRLLDDLTVVQEELTRQRAALAKEKAAAEARQRDADTALRELQAATAREEQALASVQGDIATLVTQIDAQRQADEEAAARAAAARLAQERAAAAARGPSAADLGVDPGTIPAPSPGAAAAVEFAREQIGDPYVYAGTGPDSWDCSGLTMVAWAQGGVSMSHGARDQYYSFPKVPQDQLQPGDLVFYGNPIHHVGMYVGNGTMIEAPHTGAYVRYASIYRRDYYGASRPS